MDIKKVKYSFCLAFIVIFMLFACVSNKVNDSKPLDSSLRFIKAYPSDEPRLAKLLDNYRKQASLSKLKNDPARYAKNIMSWQMDHGGFGLHDASFYNKPWDGVQERTVWMSKDRELGNFDDGATVSEVRFLADAYNEIIDPILKDDIRRSVERSIQFIFNAQYENGGWPQVYPKRFNKEYSNNVTLNDDAMIRTMVLLSDVLAGIPPFNTELVATETKDKIYPRLLKAVSYLLKAQIKNDDTLTIWSSQYEPEAYLPAPARSYELASKSARESVGVLAYLMNWPEQTTDVIAAVSSGIAWFDENKVNNMILKNGEFSNKDGAELWYRFYEVDSNIPFFTGRDGIKKYSLAQVEEERRTGYSWGGSYASTLLRVAPYYLSGVSSEVTYP